MIGIHGTSVKVSDDHASFSVSRGNAKDGAVAVEFCGLRVTNGRERWLRLKLPGLWVLVYEESEWRPLLVALRELIAEEDAREASDAVQEGTAK